VGGRREILHLLASEDVDGDQVDLGVAVLSGLGGGHVDDLAGTAFDHDVAILAESGTLERVGGGGTGISGLEGVIVLLRRKSVGCLIDFHALWGKSPWRMLWSQVGRGDLSLTSASATGAGADMLNR